MSSPSLFAGRGIRASLPRFEKCGADLFVLGARVPNTLTLQGLQGPALYSLLRQNGWIAHLDLPHEQEVGVLSAPSCALLAGWLRADHLRERICE